MRNLPGSRTCSKAALLSRAQLPETDVTFTVVDLLLSRLVTFSVVPAGNWLLEAAGAPPSPERVTVEPCTPADPRRQRHHPRSCSRFPQGPRPPVRAARTAARPPPVVPHRSAPAVSPGSPEPTPQRCNRTPSAGP